MVFYNRVGGSNLDNSATIEHLRDKWDTKGKKDWSETNLVAACNKCNSHRGSVRNRIARAYYQRQMMERGVKGTASSIKSSILYDRYGSVPQELFGVSL
jgi:hypothetical protein